MGPWRASQEKGSTTVSCMLQGNRGSHQLQLQILHFPEFPHQEEASFLAMNVVWRQVLFLLCVCGSIIFLWRAAYFSPWNKAWCQYAALAKPRASKSSCGEGSFYRPSKCTWRTVSHWKNFQGHVRMGFLLPETIKARLDSFLTDVAEISSLPWWACMFVIQDMTLLMP